MEILKQAVKFGVVGVGNTLLTLLVIWIMTKLLGCADLPSNFTGYVIGLINSYLWNRMWTFHSKADWLKSALRFLGVFAVCYVLQSLALLAMLRFCPDNPPLYTFIKPILQFFHIDDPRFYIHIVANVLYTIINFIINKFYTFKN
ncbi:MAG: GtrA family protein [Tannerella sp.]|jgi:putative flippase GtrA|nr:GtrA family protein [Tannerella sp.]